ncbi:hypothetical protein JXA05_01510 [Candidatus Peregrinibacteria bacterium]|nr:hypothetical protein [Candidatus Peregrinibacteria bacterium]
MKKITLKALGVLLLFPLLAGETLGISLENFSHEVYRPENLPGGKAGDASAETKILEILNYAIKIILYASGSVAVLMLVIGGVMVITSFGNQEKMEKGKKIVQYSLYGLVAVILAYAIVTNVIDLLYRATT